MAKYDPLCRFLRDSGKQHLDVGMDDIADMVDGGLPPSAYDRARRMWWSNTVGASSRAFCVNERASLVGAPISTIQ